MLVTWGTVCGSLEHLNIHHNAIKPVKATMSSKKLSLTQAGLNTHTHNVNYCGSKLPIDLQWF